MPSCPSCGLYNIQERKTCKNCGAALWAPRVEGEAIPVEDRKRILEGEIHRAASDGWRVQSQTDTTAQMVKDKAANGCLLIFLFCLAIVPGVLYLALFKGQDSLYIEVGGDGHVWRTHR